jgi:pteridine reductase
MNDSPVLALVTGGARRLGAHLVRALAEEGYRVAFSFHRGQAEAEALVDALDADGLEVAAYAADLRESTECVALLDAVGADFGTPGLLVNNAGVLLQGGADDATVADFDESMAVNLRAPWILSLEAGRRMREGEGGAIVNIASVGGLRPYARHLAYSVSKAGLVMLTQALARDLAPRVRVNAVAPGMIDLGEADAMPAPERVPLGSWAAPADIEEAVLYLAEATQVTGQILAVDGGWNLSG